MWLVEFASAVSGLLAARCSSCSASSSAAAAAAPHCIACILRASIPVYTSYYTLGQRATHPLQQHGILSWDLAPLWSVLVLVPHPPAPWSRCARARGCSATEHSLLAALSQCRHLGSVLSGATVLTTWWVVGRALTTAVLQADDLQPSVRRVADAGERHQLVQADV